jgi:hypothetical protein
MLNIPAPLTAADALALSIVSACVGAIIVIIVLIIWAVVRDARSARDRRDHYLTGRTIRPSSHL